MSHHKEVFFSIIIPTYNRADFILNTLQTVFDQSFQDFEIIVVDNASQDNTAKLLEPYIRDGKLKLIVHDKNYERAKSRNTGQQNANGKYVTFLDSDDFMYPDNLKDAYQYAMSHPDVRLFHNLYELVDSKREVIYKYQFNSLDNPIRAIAKGNFLSCIGVFMDREIYRNISWDETPVLVGSEDYEYWLRVLASVKNVGRINKVNNGILHHAQRTMNQLDLRAAESRVEFLIRKVETDPSMNSVYKPFLGELKSGLFIFLAGLAGKTDKKLSFQYLRMAFASNWMVLKSRSFYSNFFQLLAGFNRTSKQ
ncbi:MAG: glycosyltransferase family 2 protein [Cyclobacteriaceae bacterium]|nr:glycosyltransferase family 2 protein [Cyclobacteriaceae bacterium]